MVENKLQPEMKKAGLAKRILKNIGLGVLTLTILLALVFEVSLKIVILLVIILAAFTALPKPARKWFWLSVGVVIIALTIWVFLPENNHHWRPYIFEKEQDEFEAKYTIPYEENAAVIYNKLVWDFDPQEMRLKFLHPEVRKKVLSEPWISYDYPELALWLGEHENTISFLPQACRFKTCRFPGNFKLRVTNMLELNRYTALKSWAILLLLSANNDVAEGRLDSGLSKYACVLRMADHLYQQKRIADFLLCFSIEGLALKPVRRLVIEEQLSDSQLRNVSDSLTNLEDNWSSDFLQCLEYDKFFVKNTFCSLAFEKDTQNHVRYSRNPANAIWGRFRRSKFKETYWFRKSMKAYAILAWFVFPATPRKAAEMIDKVYEEYHAMAKSDFDWDKQKAGPPPSLELNCKFLVWLLTKSISRPYSGFHDIYLKRLAQRRGLSLLVAIKQYNIEHDMWPKSLEQISEYVTPEAFLDSTNDDGFAYILDGDGFKFYSKGENCIDEEGREKDGADDWPIWPPGE